MLVHSDVVRALSAKVLVKRDILSAKSHALLLQSASIDGFCRGYSSQSESFETKSRSFEAKRHILKGFTHSVRAQTEKVLDPCVSTS